MAQKSARPGRTLVVFLLVIGVLYGLAALAGTWKPRLGLDLEGGTRITLVAEKAPSGTKLKQAADIVDQRVNGSGVAEADVNTQGNRNIVVEIPGKNSQDLVDVVKRTAQLRFRIVAYCTQLTGSFCQASGLPQSENATPSSSPSSSPSSTTSPDAKSSTSPAAKPSKKSKAKSGQSGTNPRPAPAFAVQADTPTPTPGATASDKASPQQPVATLTPGATPEGDGQPVDLKPDAGAKLTDYLAWSKDPGAIWQLLFASARCDTKAATAFVPPITNTMDVNNPPTLPALQAQLKKLKPADYVPVVDNPDRPLIGCDTDGNKSLMSIAPINGTDLKSASAGQNTQSLGQWIVQLSFKSKARGIFADLSRKMYDGSDSPYAGGRFAIVLDANVLSTPGFNGVIPDGNAQIEGGFTEASAKSLANSLKYGALPVKFEKDVSVQVIGPSLAGDQLSSGLLAGVIGLAIVMLYCLLYYRGLGLVVIASLVVAAMITYAVVLLLAKTAGFTLTLPGIAGLIVAVGITADSFIVYFERIRDEMREGKSMRVAIQAGWVRARNTCLAADTVSFLAAAVLYIFAIGVVKGFAFALGIATLIDVAVFFWFTHPMIQLLSRRRFFNTGHRYSGLSKETLGIDAEPQLVGRSA